MKKKFFTIMTIILLIILFIIIINSLIGNNKLSESSEKKLFELLEIEDAPSFEFMYIKTFSTGLHSSPFHCFELKFKISIQDYEKNKLNYSDAEYNEILFDCSYIEKQENEIYTCVVRCTDLYEKEMHEKLREIKHNK